jgi:hypothetical protein
MVQIFRVLINLSSSKLSMPSIFRECGNLRAFQIMSSSIPTKTDKFLHSIKIGDVSFLNTRNTLISA